MNKKKLKTISNKGPNFLVSILEKKELKTLVCDCSDLEVLLCNLDKKKFKIDDIRKVIVKGKLQVDPNVLNYYFKSNPNLEFGNIKEK